MNRNPCNGGGAVVPSGFLPFKAPPGAGDKLVIYPVYLCPVEVLERGLFSRPAYYRWIVAVNAFNRRLKLFEEEKIIICRDFALASFDTQDMPVKIPPDTAAGLAEYGAVTDDFRSWRRLVRNRKIAVNFDDILLVWHIYALRGSEAIDTFTGEVAPAASLVDALFS